MRFNHLFLLFRYVYPVSLARILLNFQFGRFRSNLRTINFIYPALLWSIFASVNNATTTTTTTTTNPTRIFSALKCARWSFQSFLRWAFLANQNARINVAQRRFLKRKKLKAPNFGGALQLLHLPMISEMIAQKFLTRPHVFKNLYLTAISTFETVKRSSKTSVCSFPVGFHNNRRQCTSEKDAGLKSPSVFFRGWIPCWKLGKYISDAGVFFMTLWMNFKNWLAKYYGDKSPAEML